MYSLNRITDMFFVSTLITTAYQARPSWEGRGSKKSRRGLWSWDWSNQCNARYSKEAGLQSCDHNRHLEFSIWKGCQNIKMVGYSCAMKALPPFKTPPDKIQVRLWSCDHGCYLDFLKIPPPVDISVQPIILCFNYSYSLITVSYSCIRVTSSIFCCF